MGQQQEWTTSLRRNSLLSLLQLGDCAWTARDEGGQVSQMTVSMARWAYISVWMERVENSFGCYDKLKFSFFPFEFHPF